MVQTTFLTWKPCSTFTFQTSQPQSRTFRFYSLVIWTTAFLLLATTPSCWGRSHGVQERAVGVRRAAPVSRTLELESVNEEDLPKMGDLNGPSDVQEENFVLSRIKRQAENSTQLPQTSEPTTTASASSTTPSTTTSATTTTSVATSATTSKPNITSTILKISSIDLKNYTFVDHTSFEKGLNGWDITGKWFKNNLAEMVNGTTPVPMAYPEDSTRVEESGSDGTTGGDPSSGRPDSTKPISAKAYENTRTSGGNDTEQQYKDNYVIVNYADTTTGTLMKTYSGLAPGEVLINYYAMVNVNFTVWVVNVLEERLVLYNNMAAGDGKDGVWAVVRVPFTAKETMARNFTVVLSVIGTAASKDVPLLAVQHIAVGGLLTGPISPSGPAESSPVVVPPGSLEDIRQISSSIWTALYVFLAFFLLCILALVMMVARGRCSHRKATPAGGSDYNPNSAYRLDKVYDNPSYDASSP